MGHYARVGQDKQIDSYEEMVGKRPSFFMIPYRAHVVFTGTQIDALICPRNRNYQMLEEVAKKKGNSFYLIQHANWKKSKIWKKQTDKRRI